MSPTPEPMPEPVTNIPSDFLPGLSESFVPAGAHHIGIIIETDSDWDELQTICDTYQDRFNVTITARNCADAAQQSVAAEEMLSSGIELMIIESTNGMDCNVDELCEQQGIPYISMGNRLDAEPGQGSYVCAIVRDEYLTGVLTGISIVQAMSEKYGEPRGNIAELAGVVSDETSVMRSRGLRRVLAPHDKLRVVCSMVGGDDETAYAAAVNILKAFREGDLDGIVAVDDKSALQVLQAVLNYDRTELLGAIWTAGGTKDGLTGVWYGQFAQTVEDTAFTGMTAIEYAIQYLEGQGGSIPPVVTAVTRTFAAGTDAQKDGIAALIAQIEESELSRCSESMGDYEPFMPDAALLDRYYPTPWYELGKSYLTELEPYTTQDAIYATQNAQPADEEAE
jgi:ribose transport system substrate-binding protein